MTDLVSRCRKARYEKYYSGRSSNPCTQAQNLVGKDFWRYQIQLLAQSKTNFQVAVQLNSEYLQGQIPTLSGQPVPVFKYPLRGIFFCVHSEFPLLQPDCCLLPFPCASLRTVWLHPFCKTRQFKAAASFPLTISSPGQANPATSASPSKLCFWSLKHPGDGLWASVQNAHVFLVLRLPKLDVSNRGDAPLCQLAMLWLVQPSVALALLLH